MRLELICTLLFLLSTTAMTSPLQLPPRASPLPPILQAFTSTSLISFLGANSTIEQIQQSMSEEINNKTKSCLGALQNMANHFKSTQTLNFVLFSGKYLNELGDYDSCVGSDVSRYITMQILGLPITAAFGICGPVECQQSDYTFLQPNISEFLNDMIHGPSFEGSPLMEYNVKLEDVVFTDPVYIEKKKNSAGAGFIISVIFVILIGIIVIWGTVKDNSRKHKIKRLEDEWRRERERISILVPLNKDEGERADDEAPFVPGDKFTPPRESKLDQACSCVSITRNFHSLIHGRNTVDKNTDVLNGIRVLAILYVIYGHSFYNVTQCPLFNMETLIDMSKTMWFAVISSATFAVDIFFFLTAILGVAILYKQLKPQISIRQVLKIYLHRYIRLFPIYILSFMTYSWIAPLLGGGPVFNGYLNRIDDCESYWWYNFLYINNFKTVYMPSYTTDFTCMAWSWQYICPYIQYIRYLGCDFQFFLILPWIVYLYKYSKKWWIGLMVGLFVASGIAIIVLCVEYKLSMNFLRFNDSYFRYYYYFPYTRIAPFLMGLIVGFIYASYKDPDCDDYFHKFMIILQELAILRWLMYGVCIMLLTWCVIAPYWMMNNMEDWTQFDDTLYILFARPGVAFALSCLALPVLAGKGKQILAVFRIQIITVLAKLVYGAYMFHDIFIELRVYTIKKAIQLNHFQVWVEAFGFAIIAFMLAMFAAVLLDMPVGNLERVFIMGRRPPRRSSIEFSRKRSGSGRAAPPPLDFSVVSKPLVGFVIPDDAEDEINIRGSDAPPPPIPTSRTDQ